jgi:ribosomal protein L37AE/L43A
VTRHATVPRCPWCGARDRVVVDLEARRWHCFECGRAGASTLTLTPTTPVGGDAEASETRAV